MSWHYDLQTPFELSYKTQLFPLLYNHQGNANRVNTLAAENDGAF